MDPDEEITPDEAYGWKKVTKLAKRTDNTAEKSPFRYADTLALFASGIRLLSADPSVYITDSGRLTNDSPVSSKRAVPMEIQYKSTPAAFEGFLTKIRDERAAAAATALAGAAVVMS